MTTATFFYQNGHVLGFEVIGHANYAQHGHDIVCSGITAATFTTLNLLIRLAKENIRYSADDSISCTLIKPSFIEEEIIENLFDNLEEIRGQYPKNLKVVKLEKNK